MVTIGMNYQVVPGQEQVFEQAFRGVLSALAQTPGHAESHLYRDVADPKSYLILSEWSDRAAFDAFVGSDTFARLTAWGRKKVLSAQPRHQIYER
ncbi:MAG TPA: antibiotic biosynthesis monooxygenase family protein [Polyangia bacterium]|nr:antibiotic biosynthesis monooxygenase family protein [Polyangia bacterium]